MFYNYLKLIYSLIKKNNINKIKKINKINNYLIKNLNQNGGDLIEEKLPEFNRFEKIFNEFIEQIKNIKLSPQINKDELEKLKKTMELLKTLISEIENISDEEINKLKINLNKINEILANLIN
jgi:hypothetical protein